MQTKPRWGPALCAAIALHLAFAGFVLVQRQQPAAPEPGSGAKEFEVVMLPAWPEPGRRSAQLGSVVTPQPPQKPSPAAGPPMPLASASVVSEAAAAPVDPVRPRPVETSAAVTKVAAVTPAASAARTDMPPSTPSAAEAVWEGEVLAKLASRKRYPAGARHAGQQDTVMVHFVVDRTGRVLSSEIAESGGFAALDGEALALIQRASPFPPPPSGMAGEEIPLIVPVQFLLHKTP